MEHLVASFDFEDFTQFLLRRHPELLPPWLHGKTTGYALHHLNPRPHWIEDRGDRTQYKVFQKVLNGEIKDEAVKKLLLDEIGHLVYVPVWYHNAIHSGKVPVPSNRRECFDAIKRMVKERERLETLRQFAPKNTADALKGLLDLAKTLGRHCPRLSSVAAEVESIRTKMLEVLCNL